MNNAIAEDFVSITGLGPSSFGNLWQPKQLAVIFHYGVWINISVLCIESGDVDETNPEHATLLGVCARQYLFYRRISNAPPRTSHKSAQQNR